MTTITDNYRSDQMLWIASTIRRAGHAIICVGSGACSVPGCRCEPEAVPWSYTIGLVEQGLPELVAFGLAPIHAMELLDWTAENARHATSVITADNPDTFQGVSVRFDPVPVAWVLDVKADPMGRWWAHYGVGRANLAPPEVLQVVWADAAGRFPDEPGCDAAIVAVQPVGDELLGDWSRGLQRARPNRAARRSRARRRRS